MGHTRLQFVLATVSQTGLLALAAFAPTWCQASTVWTGPDLTFRQTSSARSDTILAGKVVLTRGTREVLYNTAAGERSARSTSPADTEWAFGALSDFASLSYQSLESMRDGDLKALILNQPMVMHLINEDIYLSVKFTAWGTHGAGGFTYVRSTPTAAAAPTVSITSPTAGATFAAPASFLLSAAASVSAGSVTNVEFFAGTTSLGAANTSPFNVTGTIAAAGTYALTAVATAGGVSSTSAVVNVTIVAPVDVSLDSESLSQGGFSFQYSVNPGLTYVVERSSDLGSWTPLSTNVPTSSPVLFTDNSPITSFRFYRVVRPSTP